jgi:hypothetical protein
MHLNFFRLILNSHVNWQRVSVNTAAGTLPFCQPQMASSLTDILSIGSCYMWFPRLSDSLQEKVRFEGGFVSQVQPERKSQPASSCPIDQKYSYHGYH